MRSISSDGSVLSLGHKSHTICKNSVAFSLYNKGMNYDNYINNTYELGVGGVGYHLYFSDGYTIDTTFEFNYNDEIYYTIYDAVNYANANITGHGAVQVIQFVDYDRDEHIGYLFFNKNIDFVKFSDTREYPIYLTIDSVYFQHDYDTFNDLSSTNCYNTTNFSGYDDLSYGSFSKTLGYSQGEDTYSVFDFTNLNPNYNNQNLKESFVIKEESFEGYYFGIQYDYQYPYSNSYLQFSIGTFAQASYLQGYEQGYDIGKADGYDEGYQIGVRDTTWLLRGGNRRELDAFDYIGKAFDSIGSIMSIEVLPNVTLGLVWTIPFVIVLIMVFFRMIKK